MTKQLTSEQARRCRGAAYELRQRARQLLEDAQMLDDWPALHLTMADLAWIADAPGMRTEQPEQAGQSQCPDRDTTTEADDDVAGTADTADGPEYRRPSSPGTTAPAPSPVSGGGRCDMEDATAEPGGGVERGGATRPSTRERAHHTLMGGGATLRRHHAPGCGIGGTVALRNSIPTPRLTTHPVRPAGQHRLHRAVGGKRRVKGPYPGAETSCARHAPPLRARTDASTARGGHRRADGAAAAEGQPMA
jgi:hypothetical protein